MSCRPELPPPSGHARRVLTNLAGRLTDEHHNDRAAMYRDLADAYNAEFKEAVAAGVEAFQLDDVDACEYACAETDCGPFTFPRPMAKGKLEAMSAAAEMLRSEYGG